MKRDKLGSEPLLYEPSNIEFLPMTPIQSVAQFLVGTSDIIDSVNILIDEDGINMSVKLLRDLPKLPTEEIDPRDLMK